MRILLLSLVFSWFALPAAGRNLYVSNVGGDDRATGFHSENLNDGAGPVRTIAKALRLAGRGDRIVLENTGQPYRESLSLVGSRHSGFPNQPFTIEGNGATLDGTLPVPPEQWKHHRDNIFRFRPPSMGAQQLFLDGRPASRVMASEKAEDVPNLDPGQWFAHRGNIYFAVSVKKLPADYALRFAYLPTGLTLYQVENVRIANLKVQGFRMDGIHVQNSGRKVTLSHVTAEANGHSGVTVGGASQVELDSCVLDRNGTAQLLTLPYGETHVRNSTLSSAGAPGWVDRGGRVYLSGKRVSGGLDSVKPEDTAAQDATQPEAEKPLPAIEKALP